MVAASGYMKIGMQLLLRICRIFVELTGNLQRSRIYFGTCEPESDVFRGVWPVQVWKQASPINMVEWVGSPGFAAQPFTSSRLGHQVRLAAAIRIR